MKTTAFVGAISCVIGLLLVSCEKKEDPNMHKVYYSSQPGYGGGGNPNPDGIRFTVNSQPAQTTEVSSSGTISSREVTSEKDQDNTQKNKPGKIRDHH